MAFKIKHRRRNGGGNEPYGRIWHYLSSVEKIYTDGETKWYLELDGYSAKNQLQMADELTDGQLKTDRTHIVCLLGTRILGTY
jgi:hypothetical protein